MPVNQPTRNDVDAAARKVVADLLTALDNLGHFKALMDGFTAERLTAAEPGPGEAVYAYAPADVDNLKALAAQHPGIVAAAPVANAITFGSRVAGLSFVRR
jgi:hypothetical protein